MIAYNKTWLHNLIAREAIEDAFYANTISKEEKLNANGLFAVGFYSPNFFIRIGLFILTTVIACFSLGLLSLLFISNIEHAFGRLILFFGLLSYATLEFFIRTKQHYRSGVDDALLWITGICIFSGINIVADIFAAANAFIIFMIATYFFLRFGDRFMSAIAGVGFLAVIFFNYISLGNIAKATVPFLLMLVSCIVYFFIRKVAQKNKYMHYRQSFTVLEIAMLICFYAAGNYYLVRETGNSMFGSALKNNESIPYGWLFWIFTICIPLIYIFWGIQKKDSILIRVGLLLIAAIVFTVHYYYAAIPLEIAMLLGGIILIVISYALTKYLAQPKKSFTSAEINARVSMNKMNIEAMLIAETFTGAATDSNPQFGGGSFGGGGASGEF